MPIDNSVEKAILFLAKSQQPNGSFLSLSSKSPTNFKEAIIFPSVFSSTLILSSLARINENETLKTIKEKLASFLLAQRSDAWSFNYWDREAVEYKKIPYPDDLDDTFSALAALHLYDPKIITGEVLAKSVSLLTTLEVDEGGPYRTWLVDENSESAWKDVDFAVNSNIGYFLSLIGVSLPKQIDFLERQIAEDKIESPYYPNSYPLIYFISRFYKGPYKDNLIKKIHSLSPSNSLDNALCALSLMNLNEKHENIKDHVEYVIENQMNGYWEAAPFYTGVNPKRDNNYFAGSDELTTGFCIEALYAFSQYTAVISQKNIEKKGEELDRSILNLTKKRFLNTGRGLQEQAIEVIDSVKRDDKSFQITLTPFYFTFSLGNHGSDVSDELLVALGSANLYGWIAYSIYDDFLDEEGELAKLSVANVALRESSGIFETILPGSGFVNHARKVIDAIDSANTWEVTMTRKKIKKGDMLKEIVLPDWGNFEKIAARSFGHALGPIAILYSLGFYDQSSEVKNLEKFFRSYLIAKQLNDDAHDWQEDLQKGHMTPVVTLLLHRMLIKKPNYEVISMNILIQDLNEIFWYDVILDTCENILMYVRKAKKYIQKIPIIEKPEILEDLLIGVENGALKAIKDRKKTVDFLNVYS